MTSLTARLRATLRLADLPRMTICTAAALFLTAGLTVLPQTRPGRRSARPPATVRFMPAKKAALIPFEFEGDSMVVRVRVNDSSPLRFLFDTGAGMSALNLHQAERLHLKRAGTVRVDGTGGDVSGFLVKGVSLGVPGVSVLDQTMVVISFDDFPCDAGVIDGIIGYDFIKEFVVEIDYEAKVIGLFDRVTYRYSGSGELLPLTIARTPRVRARIRMARQEPIEGLFEIDTGSEGTLVVNTPFVNKHRLLAGLGSRIPANGRGVGGRSIRVGARLESLQLGRSVIPAPVVSLSIDTEGALTSSDNDGPIGNVILKRFRLTLDYSRRLMWLEPNAHLADEFESDMSGIEFEAGGQDCRSYKVTDVADNSPASEAGIKVGDEILAIDGRPARELTSAEIFKLFMKENAEHSLLVGRAGKTSSLTIKLRRLL